MSQIDTHDIRDLFIEVTEEAFLQVFGERVAPILLNRVKTIDVREEKSLYGSKAFSNALAAMLGSGAIHVERLILKNLYCRLGLRWEQKKDFEFTDYVEELNRTDYAMTRLAEPRSERFYRTLLESTSDLIWVIDREGRYLYINGPLEKLIGLTNEETQGKTYGDIHTVDNTADFMAKVEQVFEGETISDEFPSSKDNRWFLRTMGPIRNESGEIEAVSIISKDITERKHAEKVIARALYSQGRIGKG